MRPNRLRQLLAAGRPTLGTRVMECSPNIVEAIGQAGVFDYVEFAAEYAPYDLYALENFCRAAELFDLGTMIKADQENQAFVAQRAVGAGFQAVLFVDIRGPEDARRALRAVRPDTPESGGQYGVALRRHCYMTYGGTADYVKALEEVVVAVMIEKKDAVERLDEILTVPGIDLVQWGPADYCMSVGRPGEMRSPETRGVERRVIDACQKAGIAVRAEIRQVEDARYYLDVGFSHLSLGTDLVILYNWWKSNGEQLRAMMGAGPR